MVCGQYRVSRIEEPRAASGNVRAREPWRRDAADWRSVASGEPPATTTIPPNAQKLQTKGVWMPPRRYRRDCGHKEGIMPDHAWFVCLT